MYEYRNILEYVDGEYIITNKITDQNLREMKSNMDDTDLEEFNQFIERHWGEKKNIKTKKNTEETAKRRGRKPKVEVEK